MLACGLSESTATPREVDTGVSTSIEYSPGEKTRSDTGSSGSASTPATCRVSRSKPFTVNRVAPRSVSSIAASGLVEKRQVGATPTQPARSTRNAVVPSCGPAW